MTDLIDVSVNNDGSYGIKFFVNNDACDVVTRRMVENAEIPAILKPICCSNDHEYFYSFMLRDSITASEAVKKGDDSTLESVCEGILNACISVEEYMLDANSVILDCDYMFYSFSSGQTKLLCFPGFPGNVEDIGKSLSMRAAEAILSLIRRNHLPPKSVASTLFQLLTASSMTYKQMLHYVRTRYEKGLGAVIENRKTGECFELFQTSTTIGRSSVQDVVKVSSSPAVSRSHAQIEFDRDTWVIRDIRASNGTLVRSKLLKCGDYTELGCGDEFMLADESFVFFC